MREFFTGVAVMALVFAIAAVRDYRDIAAMVWAAVAAGAITGSREAK